ncbi:MAG: DNA repair protein RadA, partial [Candidatus Marinimicrobia bacterium CG_4_10_14_0_2_um_filter_48_9]
VSGSLILIGGEPGIGKSTLLAIVLGALVQREDLPCALYVSGEESLSQVAERMQRLNCEGVNLYVLHQNNWQEIKKQIKKIRPKYLVIDSIQTTVSDNVASAPGSISQI